MFLCPPRNDIPHGREHISAPAKHLPLLCCPSAALCHPAHSLMDGADGHGCLPDSRLTPPAHQREGARGGRGGGRGREHLHGCSTLSCQHEFEGQEHGGSSMAAQMRGLHHRKNVTTGLCSQLAALIGLRSSMLSAHCRI